MDNEKAMIDTAMRSRQWTARIRDEWEADEEYDDDRYMGSDSDFSDHALGIDY